MTRFQPQGSRIEYRMGETSDRDRETPFKQIVGLYGMWNSLGPETKLRIKKALGIDLNPEDELALRRLDAQRARLQDYLDNGNTAERYSNAFKTSADEQQAIQDSVGDQLAAAQQLALDTPYQWTGEAPASDITEQESGWSNIRPTGRTPRRDPDLSRPAKYTEGMPRPSISWVDDFSDTWEY